MKNIIVALSIFILNTLPSYVAASEAIAIGEINQIRYRSEYVNFKVIYTDGNGVKTNRCAQCGPDVSKYSAGGFCYVHKDKKNLMSLFLSTYAMSKKVSGRVSSWDDCNIYEFHLYD